MTTTATDPGHSPSLIHSILQYITTAGSIAMSFCAFRCLATATPSTALRRGIHGTHSRHEQFLNANAETFNKVIAPDRLKSNTILVDFYADWCHPCKMLSPILHKLTTDEAVRTGSGRSLDLVTVNTDVEFELAQKYKVRAMPTVIAFQDGQPVDQFVGALNEAGVRAFIQKI